MKTRYLKVIRDLTSDIPKNLMLVLAIGIGVFGVGAILGAYHVLTREMRTNYLGSNPASATIEIEGSIPEHVLHEIRSIPGIKHADRRATITGRMKVGDRWYPLLLFVIDDFQKTKVSMFKHVSGSSIPATGEMLIERTTPSVMNAAEGESVAIKLAHGEPHDISIKGTVHDPGLAPAWQEQAGYAYISLATLRLLGAEQGFDLLRIQVSENQFSRDHITRKAQEVSDWLENHGLSVHEIQIPPPGMHPHQSQMTAVLSIFTIFSFMVLGLGSILVATTMATLMMKQVRQIGIMKAIGGTSSQIASMYLMMIVIVCILALAVSIPLSRVAASAFVVQIAKLLNLEIMEQSIPLMVPVIQIVSGILIPVLAAAIPLLRGSRITVRAALDNHGVSPGTTPVTPMLSRLYFFGDTFNLSLRNAFRQRSRLALTIGLLAAGGAMFMTALNISDAWDKNLKRIYTQRLYDQEIRFSEYLNPGSLLAKLNRIEGVRVVEGWDYCPTSVPVDGKYEITKTYPDKGHGSFSMLALPVSSKLVNPTITEGQWLHTEGTNDVVLNQLARNADMKVGDDVALTIEGKITHWKIIGFTEDVGSPAIAYVSIRTFSQLNNCSDKFNTMRIAYKDRSPDYAAAKNIEVENLLEEGKISVSSSTPVWLLHNAVAAHMKVLVNSLLAMAILMAVVGTLGLTSTISMNVLERTREIGVMRAIGATPAKIKNLIILEGVIIGILSIVIAFAFSIALSYFMGRFIGHISFRNTLTLTISIAAIAIWIAIILLGSYAATIFPARKANNVTTREALGYE